MIIFQGQRDTLVGLTLRGSTSNSVAQCKTLSELYDSDVFKVYCVGLQRIAFDQRIENVLQSKAACAGKTYTQIFIPKPRKHEKRKRAESDGEEGISKRVKSDGPDESEDVAGECAG